MCTLSTRAPVQESFRAFFLVLWRGMFIAHQSGREERTPFSTTGLVQPVDGNANLTPASRGPLDSLDSSHLTKLDADL